MNNFTPFHPSSLTSKCYSSLLLKTTFRSSCSQMFFKIGVLKNFAILTGKHLLWNNFIKMRLQLRVFSYKYRKIFKTSFFYSTTPMAVFGYLHYFLIPFSCYVHQQLQNDMCFSFCIYISRSQIFKRKNVTLKKKHVLLPKLKEEFQENFKGELDKQ